LIFETKKYLYLDEWEILYPSKCLFISELPKRRERGESLPKDYTKNEIILIVAKNYPAGIEEPDLREILRD
jgi:hypothetical protein